MYGFNPYQGYNPYQQTNNYQPQQAQQPNNNLIRVTGLDGAKAYQMGANQSVALFDANEDMFYVKSTDGASFPTIRAFRFEEITQNQPSTENNYVTKEEMENYVKQLIQNARARAEAKSTTDA